MSREIRKVKSDWIHPRDEFTGKYEPLNYDYKTDFQDFENLIQEQGVVEAVEYWGGGPLVDDYMPSWTEEEKTHYQMYEVVTEGTPISPVFDTPENLAKWLSDTGASSFGSSTATYEQWLRICKGGYSPSMVFSESTGLVSGVEVAL